MKKFSLISRLFSFLGQGIAILSSLIVLQAACGGTAGHKASSMGLQQFKDDIANQKDISIPDEKGRSQPYACVKKNELEKLKVIVKRFIDDIQSGFQHKHENVLNDRDPISGYTCFEYAIIKNMRTIVDYLIGLIRSNESSGIIKFDTIHPASGNTLIHFAIEARNLSTINKLFDLLKDKRPDLLSLANNNQDTLFHFAAKHKLGTVQNKFIDFFSASSENALWIKNKKGEDALDIGIENDQNSLIQLIDRAPLERFIEQNNERLKLLHVLAHKHLVKPFIMAIRRIKQLDKHKAVDLLFEETRSGKSVWAYIILSKINIRPLNHKVNVEMFTSAIQLVKDSLAEKHWSKILSDIAKLEGKSFIQGNINKEYADELRKIVEQEKKTAKFTTQQQSKSKPNDQVQQIPQLVKVIA